MILGLLGLIWLDNRIDQIQIQGTVLQKLFAGRSYLPAGLLMLALALVIIPLTARELGAIFRAKGIASDPLLVSLAAMIGCVAVYAMPARIDSQKSVAILGTVLVGLFLASLIRHSWNARTQGAVAAAGVTMFTMIYLGFLPGFYILIRRWHDAWIIAGILLVTKSCDIGAYFTGRALGRHKLIPWLSPGKTWEGLIGGVTLSTVVAVLLTMLANHLQVSGHYVKTEGMRLFNPVDYPLWAAAAGGLLLGVVGQFGDLCASLFKRDAGIKDSGSLIPGFGGVLDVVDSPLGVAPLAYWLIVCLETLGQ